MKRAIGGIILIFLVIVAICQAENAIELNDEYDDVIHSYKKGNRIMMDTELRPHLDIIRFEALEIDKNISIEFETVESINISNTTTYSVFIFNENLSIRYYLNINNLNITNSSNLLEYYISDNVFYALFNNTESLILSECIFGGVATEITEDNEEMWFDFTLDFFPPYLLFNLHAGISYRFEYGLGAFYFGYNFHSNKTVDLNFTTTITTADNTREIFHDISIKPQKSVIRRIRVPILPLIADVNITIKTLNYTQTYLGTKFGPFLKIDDIICDLDTKSSALLDSLLYHPEFFQFKKTISTSFSIN